MHKETTSWTLGTLSSRGQRHEPLGKQDTPWLVLTIPQGKCWKSVSGLRTGNSLFIMCDIKLLFSFPSTAVFVLFCLFVCFGLFLTDSVLFQGDTIIYPVTPTLKGVTGPQGPEGQKVSHCQTFSFSSKTKCPPPFSNSGIKGKRNPFWHISL